MSNVDPLVMMTDLLERKGGQSPNEAAQLANLIVTVAKWRAPNPRALPEFAMARLIGARPPWSWMNLDDDQAEYLDEQLDKFVADYNAHLTTRAEDVIPPCWRRHPFMVQILPPLFFAWFNSHRDPDAHPVTALTFYERHLWTFQERLPTYLGATARDCRAGRHHDPSEELTGAIDTSTDLMHEPAVRGPDITDDARTHWFGTEPL